MDSAVAPAAYEWFVDGVTMPEENRSTFVYVPVYEATGTATLKVRATMPDGQVATADKTVQIVKGPAPTVKVRGPSLTPEVGTAFSLDAVVSGNGPLTYLWSYPGDCAPQGDAAAARLTLVCSGASASYVTVTVSQRDGLSTTSPNYPLVVREPQPGFLYAQITGPGWVRVGQTAEVTVNVRNALPGWTVLWSVSGNPAASIQPGYSTSPTTKVSATASGSVILTAVVSSPSGETVTEQYTLEVLALEVTGLRSIPEGLPVTFRAHLTGDPAGLASTWWSSPNGWISGTTVGPEVTVLPTGTGEETLTVTAYTASGDFFTQTFTFTATSPYAATLGVPAGVTTGRATPVSVAVNRASTVMWSTDRPDCKIAAPTALSSSLTCGQPGGQVVVTMAATDSVTGQVLTRTATSSVLRAAAWKVTASGTNPVTMTATLTDTTFGMVIPGATVAVQGAWYGTSTYGTSATLKTDSAGRVTWKAPAARAAYYRLAYAGTSTIASTTSTSTLVRMATKTALSVKTGYPTMFSGTVLNAVTSKAVPTGTPVALKVKWYGTSTWVTVANLKTDAYGKVTWRWNANRNGYFQLVYAGNFTTVSSASTAPLVRIPTKMTMSVKSGRPDVLTGRLLTGAGAAVKYQYVTLQYRTYGTSTWRTVTRYKSSSTAYVTAKVQPKKRTYYRWVYSGTTTGYLPSTSGSG